MTQQVGTLNTMAIGTANVGDTMGVPSLDHLDVTLCSDVEIPLTPSKLC